MHKTCTCRACGKLFSRKKPKPYCSPACRLTHKPTQGAEHNTPNDNTNTTPTTQQSSVLEGAISRDRNTQHNT